MDLAKLRKEAVAGNAKSQHLLGLMYREGQQVKRNLTEAERWFGRAAGWDFPPAQYIIPYVHFTGKGVPIDMIEAHVWSNIAVSNGNINAPTLRAEAGKQLTLEQLKEAQDRAKTQIERMRTIINGVR